MKKTTRLRNAILERRALVCPGAHDAISAMLIEKAGFEALQVSGFGLAASYLGMPDMAFLSSSHMVDFTRNIIQAVSIPVMADADTGFGSAANAAYATRQFILAGAAGMNLEDQLFPKRCGHMEGKQVIPLEEMVHKIKACIVERNSLDPDFVLNARTDAIALEGVDSAIRRANAYVEAGADIIFMEAVETLEQMDMVIREVKAPVSINLFDFVSGGKTPLVSIHELRARGVGRVSIPVGPLFAAYKGMENYLAAIASGDIPANGKDLVVTFADFKKLVRQECYARMG